jgi:hypothetical protein
MNHAPGPRRARTTWLAAAVTICITVFTGACSAGPGASQAASAPVGAYPGWPGSGSIVTNTDFLPGIVNQELATETTRVMVSLEDGSGRDLASPDLTLQIGFFDLATSTTTPASTATGTFRWLIPDAKAIYTAPVHFARAGDWGMEVTAHATGKDDRTARFIFSVRDTTTTPAIGAAAIPSETLTASDPAAIVAISTDANPDPAFYRLSIKDAIASGEPTVIVFATPLFCTSGTCGPALELVKQVAPAYEDRVNFVHVEPYLLKLVNGHPQPDTDLAGNPQPIRAVAEWGLPTEPFVIVVDASGKVADKYEGMAYPDELTAALDALLP